MRVMGVDLGTRRIGVAVSDPTGLLASPHAVVERSADPAVDRARLVALAAELGAKRVVVGLPLSLDGRRGPAARAAQAEIDALAEAVGVPVEARDERLTTVSAARGQRERKVPGRARRRTIDAEAAAVLLQGFLDARGASRR